MTGTLSLYYSPGACSLAPHVVLEEIGVPFEAVRVAIADGAQRRADYLAINPRGRVPTLRIGETCLTENPAILTWLANAHPEAGLLPPAGSAAQLRALEWLGWLSSTVHVLYAQVWRSERFVGPCAPPEVVGALRMQGRVLIEQAYAEIEERLDGRVFALGEAFSLVDANLLPFYRFGGRLGLDMRRDYPAWTAYTETIHQRPAVRRALQREEITLWPEPMNA
jgi:glutathione S-transferase